MTSNPSPLIQKTGLGLLTPLSVATIEEGCVGFLLKNGRLVRTMPPGRYMNLAVPLLEQCQLLIVDTRLRTLRVQSKAGDFCSRDQQPLKLTLSLTYQVIDAKRVALELSDPLEALTVAVKDNLALLLGGYTLAELQQDGPLLVRDLLITRVDAFYPLGFHLEEVRVSNLGPDAAPLRSGRKPVKIPAPEPYMQSAEDAEIQALRASLGTPEARVFKAGVPETGVSKVKINEAKLNSLPDVPKVAATFVVEAPIPTSRPTPVSRTLSTQPTELAAQTPRLVHLASGESINLARVPLTFGRDGSNRIQIQDLQCSRYHACISLSSQESRQYHLIDLGSSNGTFVDGQRLKPHEPVDLRRGEVIRMGQQEWVFET
ncbi:FHA domain-containing protein [Leptolyngbya sp. FACHB-261]|uniref:FHA domain-containing protein n=1 Tax=Leptolyngbya sp. FACHB-261 TaxID=2692806 RepID=UPI0016841F43|nr:FHA domain-containing protein [Leptolyngbya sp. FACHB-261]MBD2105312.1 FHA domain-containing protein [Leptolyngbya sp. FACHB-261]